MTLSADIFVVLSWRQIWTGVQSQLCPCYMLLSDNHLTSCRLSRSLCRNPMVVSCFQHSSVAPSCVIFTPHFYISLERNWSLKGILECGTSCAPSSEIMVAIRPSRWHLHRINDNMNAARSPGGFNISRVTWVRFSGRRSQTNKEKEQKWGICIKRREASLQCSVSMCCF